MFLRPPCACLSSFANFLKFPYPYTQDRSRITKMACTHSISPLKYLCHRIKEALDSIGRPQCSTTTGCRSSWSPCRLILSFDRISFVVTPLLLPGSLIYPQAIMAMYHTFSNHATAWVLYLRICNVSIFHWQYDSRVFIAPWRRYILQTSDMPCGRVLHDTHSSNLLSCLSSDILGFLRTREPVFPNDGCMHKVGIALRFSESS